MLSDRTAGAAYIAAQTVERSPAKRWAAFNDFLQTQKLRRGVPVILPYDEVEQRLAALDMVNPVFSPQLVEEHLQQFIASMDKYPYSFLPSLPIIWLNGTHDYRAKLLDMGILPRFAQYGVAGRLVDNWSFYNAELPRKMGHTMPHGTSLMAIYRDLLLGVSPLMSYWSPHALCNLAMLRAFEAGLGFYMVVKEAIVLFPRPGLRTRRETARAVHPALPTPPPRTVLHSTHTAAVHFPLDEASNQHWIRGVRVPGYVVETPERITMAHIRAARTPEMRRTLIDQYGLIRYSLESGFKEVDRSEKFGVILYVRGGNHHSYGMSQRRCVVELINATPEPNGEHRRFGRRVPGHVRNAHEAVAWTFGFDNARDYHPVVQT